MVVCFSLASEHCCPLTYPELQWRQGIRRKPVFPIAVRCSDLGCVDWELGRRRVSTISAQPPAYPPGSPAWGPRGSRWPWAPVESMAPGQSLLALPVVPMRQDVREPHRLLVLLVLALLLLCENGCFPLPVSVSVLSLVVVSEELEGFDGRLGILLQGRGRDKRKRKRKRGGKGRMYW